MIKVEKQNGGQLTLELDGEHMDLMTEFYILVNSLLDADVYTEGFLLYQMSKLIEQRKKKEAEDGEFKHL